MKGDRVLGVGEVFFAALMVEMKKGFCRPDQEKADSKIKGASKWRLTLCLHITF